MQRLIAVIVLAACGGHSSSGSARPTASPAPAASPVATTTESEPPPVGRADERCEQLIAHALTLAVAERPADQQLTADERSHIEAQLRNSWVASCRAMSAQGYRCAITAHSLGELDGCTR